MRRLIPLAFFLVIGGCAAPGPSAFSSAISQIGPVAGDTQGPFDLEFELPRDTWKAGETIDGVATLALATGGAVDVSGSGTGLIGFDYASVDGAHHVAGIEDLVCRSYRLEAGKPMTSPLTKSGGFYPEQPDFEFNRAFLTAPTVRLPAGDWKITAVASFVEGQGCSGQSRTMGATVLVHVTP